MTRHFPWQWLIIGCLSLLFSCVSNIIDSVDGTPDEVDCISDCDK